MHWSPGEKCYMNIVNQNITTITTNWWPVTDEEWERLNYPERFSNPKKDEKPVDNQQK